MNLAFTLYDLYQLWEALRNRHERIPNGWRLALRCDPPGTYHGRNFQSASNCWAGNVFPGSFPLFANATFPTANTAFWENTAQRPHPSQPGLYEGRVFGLARYVRIVPSTSPLAAPAWVRGGSWVLDPNIHRRLPSERPSPARTPARVAPETAPFIQPDRAAPQPAPSRRRPGRLTAPPRTLEQIALEIALDAVGALDPATKPALGPKPAEWTWTNMDFPAPPHARQQTRRRENKQLSRLARIGIALYRALDRVSESAEVVDALFGALPADVQKRWSKGREDRKFLDAAGQYGIDGADWKLQALYHNWSKLDVGLAIENIIRNEIQDSIIGRIKGVLPKQYGNATREADIAVATTIDTVTARVIELLKRGYNE